MCIGAYLTTALDPPAAEVFLEYINDMIHSYKAKYQDPYIILAGDWNRADTDIAVGDFPGLLAVPTPPTRGDETLDITFTNFGNSIVEAEVCPPLLPDLGRQGRPLDHNVILIQVQLPKSRKFRWMKYSYRKYTPEGDAAFGQWIVNHDWS